MTDGWQRLGAVLLLALLGAGILVLMGMTIMADGTDGRMTMRDLLARAILLLNLPFVLMRDLIFGRSK